MKKDPDLKWFSYLVKTYKSELPVLQEFLKSVRAFEERERIANGTLSIGSYVPLKSIIAASLDLQSVRKAVSILHEIQTRFFLQKEENNPSVIPLFNKKIKIKEYPSLSWGREVENQFDFPRIEGLSAIPTGEIEKQINIYLTGAKNYTSDKMEISIDDHGIRRADNAYFPYEIRGARKRILEILLKKKMMKLSALASVLGKKLESNVSRDVGAINKIFMKNLEVEYGLIGQTDSGGYYIDRDHYEIN